MVELIQQLAEAFGPSGHESAVRELIHSQVASVADEVYVDALGNLIARKVGSSPHAGRLLVAAHMDEIGLMVTHIDDDGFLRFDRLGGVHPYTLLGQRVRFATGLVGSIGCERLDDPKDVRIDRLFIDIGARSREEATSQVRIGDAACYDRSVTQSGNRLIGKALDDRAGCAVLIEALRRITQPAMDVYAVFSVQEEVGARGAKAAAYAIEPTVAVAVDVTPTGDTPKGEQLPVKLGDGAAIKVKDSSMMAHPRVKAHLTSLAETAAIPHQFEVLPYGGTDAGPIHVSRAGVPSGVISIPTRFLHSPAEMVDLGDLEACVALTTALMQSPFEL